MVQPNAVGSYPAQMSLALPDILTISLRQRIDPRTTLLAGFEFDRWTRIQSMPITSLNGGTTYGTLAPNYKNGWMVSMGGQVGNAAQVLLGMVLIGLVAWLMESLVFRRLERHYQHWHSGAAR